jgi:hypothetical protein
MLAGGAVAVEERHITAPEVGDAIGVAARGRAPGSDGAPAGTWQSLGGRTLALFALIVYRCWDEKPSPAGVTWRWW